MTLSMVDLGKRLLEAAKHGLTEEVRTLMSNGAPFTTDWLGTSPLHFSSHYGHLGTSEVLLRAGISRDARTKVDRTPLHVAAQEGHLDIVELLVRNGADIDAKDMLKMTPLHWAVEKGHSVVIEFLLEHGAEVSCQNKFEKSPIDIAITNGRADLAQLLQQNVVEVSTSAEEHHPYVGEVTEVSAAEAETIAATESVGGGDNIVTTSTGGGYINTHHITSGKKGESTEVLATLAALAEVTAGSSTAAAEGTTTTPTTTDTDTLKWLESQGITMISADNSTIVGNTVENGQQLTLTEAGRLALNHIVKQKIGDNAETNGNIVTIVSSDGIENAMGDSIVMSCDGTEINTDDHDGEPSLKRIKLEQHHTDDEGLDPHEGVVLDDDINIKLEGGVVEEQYGVEEEYPPTETTVVEGLGVEADES